MRLMATAAPVEESRLGTVDRYEQIFSHVAHDGILTSGVYKATAPDVAFPQEKSHFAEPDCAE
jgi:hypothetical protein